MNVREVGSTGQVVGAIGLGCMGMSWGYRESARDDDVSIRVIREAVERGVTLIDTADIYGDGHNESLVGRALSGIRDDVVISTKGGLVVDNLESRAMHRDASARHMRDALDASLKRLGVDGVDLYYLHRVDENVPLEETWAQLAEFVTSGRVRHLGLSEVSVSDAALVHAIHPVAAIQSEMSLWTRDALVPAPDEDTSVLDWTSANGAMFVPFAPLGRGFLSGSIGVATSFESSDFRASNPRFSDEARRANETIISVVRSVALRRNVTPAQIALAWTLAQSGNVIPIPGTKSSKHLVENIEAASVHLDDQDLRELNELPAAMGSRY
ncbi:aldo/keto reductase [Agreia sp. PsM10]|uniref:aldo/keto reductase n=1 Tax=Agreia sp. PsM10 TaxID=3030533 RepID=UPI00263BA5E6|nr:aldo/keto reductase [Agreia sp. PsM10]MDN4639425.1 aldo/keto reductase [Agreia sp. PsM10]